MDVSLTPLQSPTTPASLVYNSDSVSVRPIIQARLNSANNGALPSQITAVLTWNGGTPITFTYSTANSNPGDALTIAAQVPYPVTATGRYTWKLEVTAGSFDQTTNGSMFVVANDNSPFGAGWTFGPTDHLVNIPADAVNNLPAGILRVYGAGGYRFYSGASLSSPANDNGALMTSSGGGWVYTDAGGVRKTFDANGNQTSTVSADGHRTTLFTYDTFGRLAGVSTPDGGVSSFRYNSSGQVGTIQGPGGRTYGLAYSGADLASVADALGHATTYLYDANGNLHTTIDPLGRVTTNNYDAMGRLIQTVDASGASSSKTYDNAGVELTSTDALGRKSQPTYDGTGRGLATQQSAAINTPAAASTQTWYDANGRVTKTQDANGKQTQIAYDAKGQPIQTTDANGGVMQTEYDADGRVTKVQDALSRYISP